MAAMAALAALLRIVYRLATDRAARADNPATIAAREVAMARSGERGYLAALAASGRARKAAAARAARAARQRPQRRSRRLANVRPGRRPMRGKEAALQALIEQPDMSPGELAERFGASERTGRRWREEARQMAAATANGSSHE